MFGIHDEAYDKIGNLKTKNRKLRNKINALKKLIKKNNFSKKEIIDILQEK